MKTTTKDLKDTQQIKLDSVALAESIYARVFFYGNDIIAKFINWKGKVCFLTEEELMGYDITILTSPL